MFIAIIYIQLKGIDNVSKISIWQIALLAITLGLRGESLINLHNLEEHVMRLNYLVSSVLADVSLLVLLLYLMPGGKYFDGKGLQILGVYILVKGLFYLTVHIKSLKGAKEINERLSQNR